ncbi:MAG TPA: 1-acyl-sn-glycerol-3-phosphate acyltransferase [Caulobacteraceae bacterium]|nr:1-acyl-sn-glycerol-3-phosphate acyltransferase [Caulobacteraceae bacterium]
MVVVQPTDALATPVARNVHIVDELIEERAPSWVAKRSWPLIRPLLYRLLDYRKAVRLADALKPMRGQEAIDHCSDLLGLKVTTSGLERVPPRGRLVVIVNHPTGIADGVAVYDALKAVRPDMIFFANADAFRVAPGFGDILIPVEWVEAKRTREKARQTLTLARAALEAERALVVFPAGRISRRRNGVVADPEWAPSAVSLARKHDAPVAPIRMTGPYSTLFHLFDGVSNELRDITLFHELLNKRGDRYRLTIGPLVPHDALEGDAGEITERLKAYIERVLPNDPDRPFR